MDLLRFLAVCLPLTVAASSNCPSSSYTQVNGTISSPVEKGKYPLTADCSYNIRVPTGRRAVLSFVDFNVLGAMPNCTEASVEVFVSCGERRPVGKFCSCGLTPVKPFDVYSIDECITVVFKSNGKAQGAGFKANYTSAVKNVSVTAASQCSDVKLNASGNFFSPHWPQNYPSNTSCKWTLDIPKDNNGFISLMNINLEASAICNPESKQDDYVTITGVTEDGNKIDLEKRLCTSITHPVFKSYTVGKMKSVSVGFFSEPDLNTGSGFVAGFLSYRTDGAVNKDSGKCTTEKPVPGGHTSSLVSSFLLILIAALLSFEWQALQ